MKIGLIGLGAIGRLHFDCWRRCPGAELVAISDRNPGRLAGEWEGKQFNLGAQAQEKVDLRGIVTFGGAAELIADPNVEAVDICMPTPWHAPLAIAALQAGKHVFCEKPMALSLAECVAMERAAQLAGRQLMVGHCLRYWPHYVKAWELLRSGEFGRAVYASFHRESMAPTWSGSGWYLNARESGGVLDLHIHDIDVALWWFGRPTSILTNGHVRDGLPMILDAAWGYENGLAAHLHGAWDSNGGEFRHAFRLVMEKATLVYDLARHGGALQLLRGGEASAIPLGETAAHQAEIDDFVTCIRAGRAVERVTPADSRVAVELGLEELQQLEVGQG